MAIAVDPEKTFNYVLKEERELPIEKQTIWKIKVLSARELADIEDNTSRIDREGVLQVRHGTVVLNTLRKGLRGWENFLDAEGKPVPFRDNNGVPREDNFDRMKPHWRREICNAITEQNRMSDDQIKNSESGQEPEK